MTCTTTGRSTKPHHVHIRHRENAVVSNVDAENHGCSDDNTGYNKNKATTESAGRRITTRTIVDITTK